MGILIRDVFSLVPKKQEALSTVTPTTLETIKAETVVVEEVPLKSVVPLTKFKALLFVLVMARLPPNVKVEPVTLIVSVVSTADVIMVLLLFTVVAPLTVSAVVMVNVGVVAAAPPMVKLAIVVVPTLVSVGLLPE